MFHVPVEHHWMSGWGGASGFVSTHKGTIATNNPVNAGATAWTNPIGAIDSLGSVSEAEALLSSSYSQLLDITGFNFNIPSNATVTGILVQAIARVGSSFDEISLGAAPQRPSYIPALSYTTIEGVQTYAEYSFGTTSSLWGTTWTPAEINASTFGLVMEASDTVPGSSAYVTQATISVYYTISETEGYRTPTSAAGWTNPNNALTDDGLVATTSVQGGAV